MSNTVFDFSSLSEEAQQPYSLFTKFFKDEIKKFSTKYNISPVIFNIINDRCRLSANSGYICDQGYFIRLTQHFIIGFYNRLLKFNDNNYREFKINCFSYFIFHHEFRHLLQNRAKNHSFPTSIIEKHAYEYDADFMGIRFVLDYVWVEYDKNKMDKKEFKNLLILALSSIVISFLISYYKIDVHKKNILIPNFPNSFYLEENDHPHPLVRVVYIVQMYYQEIEANYKELITFENIFNETLEEVKLYFDNCSTCQLLNEIDKNIDEINKYVERLYSKTLADEVLCILRNKDQELIENRHLFT